MTKKKAEKPDRKISLPGNSVGKQRQALYANAYTRIDEAIKQGFFLEAITIEESIITDRLEARVAWLSEQTQREFRNLGPLVQILQGKGKNKKIQESDPKMLGLLPKIDEWREQRNEALHELVKFPEDVEEKCWEDFYSKTKKVAKEGKKLSRKVSNCVKRLNKKKP
jgi:hypothetical protein